MKIAFIGQKGIPAKWGGIEYHVENLAKRLVKRGHDVTIYVRNWYTDKNLSEYEGIRLVHTFSVNAKNFDTFVHSFTSILHILFQKYDIIHFHGLGPSFFSLIPKILNKNILVTIHSLDWQAGKWGKFAKTFLKFCEIPAMFIPSRTVVVSKALKNYFEGKYKKETIYIPNGVNIPEFLPEPDIIRQKYNLEPKKYLLYMGRLTPEKRVDWLIKSFSKQNTEYKLVIAGGSSGTDKYAEGLKKINQDDKIIFIGYVAGKEKEEIFSNALLYIQASYLEGLPIAVLEAMSYSLPCLVSDIPAHQEIVSDEVDGFLFPTNSFDVFVEKLKEVISLPGEKLREIGQKAKEKAKKEYNWDNITEKTDKIYQKVLGKK